MSVTINKATDKPKAKPVNAADARIKELEEQLKGTKEYIQILLEDKNRYFGFVVADRERKDRLQSDIDMRTNQVVALENRNTKQLNRIAYLEGQLSILVQLVNMKLPDTPVETGQDYIDWTAWANGDTSSRKTNR